MLAEPLVRLGRATVWRALGLASPLWVRNPWNGSRLRVLAYHGVPDRELFRQQVAYLTSNFAPVEVLDVVHFLEGRELAPRSCWVTFDDGHPSVIDLGLPVLDEFEVPATLFVCPGLVDTTEPFWWQVIEEAAGRGIVHESKRITLGMITHLKQVPDETRRETVERVRGSLERAIGHRFERRQITSGELKRWHETGRTLGNHTWDHPMLDRSGADEQRWQIEAAHDWLSSHFGPDHPAFAYPNGNATDASRQALEGLGYQVGVLFDHRIAGRASPLSLSRLRVDASDELIRFKARISGAHSSLHRLLRRP